MSLNFHRKNWSHRSDRIGWPHGSNGTNGRDRADRIDGRNRTSRSNWSHGNWRAYRNNRDDWEYEDVHNRAHE